MIRNHGDRIDGPIDGKPLGDRGVMPLPAVLSLPVSTPAVRTLGETVGLGRRLFAHVPVVGTLIALRSIGCDCCRGESV